MSIILSSNLSICNLNDIWIIIYYIIIVHYIISIIKKISKYIQYLIWKFFTVKIYNIKRSEIIFKSFIGYHQISLRLPVRSFCAV